jgi:tripartite-type tricarboxylate transporter receptor subunit TctC
MAAKRNEQSLEIGRWIMRVSTRWPALTLASLAALAALAAAPLPATADDYPNRPVRIVVPYPAGDPADVLARAYADEASKGLGQKFVVENRPGAIGIIGTNIVAKSPADGYTLVVTTLAHSTNPYVNAKMPYDTRKDFTPISMLGRSPGAVFVVSGNSEAKTLDEFVKMAKNNPGKLTFANAGIGQMSGIAGELFMKMTDVKMVSVPYAGASSYATDLITNRVNSGVMGLIGSVQHVKSGTLRALALTGPKRTPVLPDVPTFRELGYAEMNLIGWFGILGPAGIPRDRVDLLYREAAKAVKSPAFQQLLIRYGIDAAGTNPDEFAKFIDENLDQAQAIVKRIGYVPPNSN